MAKKARVYDGTAWQELASAQTDLTAYSTTAQMNTAITAGVGLVPILTQTIGTAVSSIVVNNAFSTTYDNYLIQINNSIASSDNELRLKLGASTTGYNHSSFFLRYSGSTVNILGSNTTSFICGAGLTGGVNISTTLINPFLARYTFMQGTYTFTDGSSSISGHHSPTTSYTDFTITTTVGTLTGGTIQVYGYKK